MADRAETIYELFVQTVYGFVKGDGQQVMTQCVDTCLSQIEFYREQVLACDDPSTLVLENKAQLFDVKTMIRLLQDCAGDLDSK